MHVHLTVSRYVCVCIRLARVFDDRCRDCASPGCVLVGVRVATSCVRFMLLLYFGIRLPPRPFMRFSTITTTTLKRTCVSTTT